MPIYRHAQRLSLTLAVIAGLVAIPATPGFAASVHARLLLAAFTPALTLSDNDVRVGLVRAKFITANTSATHTLVTLSSSPVAVVVADATTVSLPANCTGKADGSVQTTPVTCSLPNTGPNTTAPPIPMQFLSPAACPDASCTLTFSATATYSQGTISSATSIISEPNAAPVQLFTSDQASRAAGDCPKLSVGATKTIGTTLSASVPQAAQLTFGTATEGPCTPAAAGAQEYPSGKPAGFALNQVWFLELQPLDAQANNGLATGTLVVNLPPGVNKKTFQLREFNNDLFSGAFNANDFAIVQPCSGSPLQPTSPADTCISGVSNLPSGAVAFNLILNPRNGDASFGG